VTDTTDVPAGVDAARVGDWFTTHVPQAVPPLRYDRVAGGHSCITYVVTDAEGERFVLRRPPLGHVLATAHDVAREHRVMSAMPGTGVPVPTMLGLCRDETVNGAPFYVMSHVEGVVLHTAADTERLLPAHEARRRAADTMVDALVALHAVGIDAVGLGDFARRTGYLDRQLKRWSLQWEASKTRELPAMEQLHAWLVENRPAQPETTVVHGDFRLGNALHGPDGTTRAVLDWELSTLGDPLADVAYLLRWWATPDQAADGTGPATAAEGFPTADEVAERYASLSGRSLHDVDYWLALNAWRSAAISEGVYRRYIDGAMGEVPEGVERYARAVELTVAQGLAHAGLPSLSSP
jgi:aminoglycoside phosphotransferase (APT) family kinase protein